jgi:hypothetical protein
MKNLFKIKIVSVALLALVGVNAKAGLLYTTFPNANGGSFVLNNGQSLGNQIYFGNTFTLTNFTFEYYTTNATFSGNVGVDLKFYKNDGPLFGGNAMPGTLVYDSGLYSNPSNGGKLLSGGPGTNGFHTISYDTSDFGNVFSNVTTFTFVLTFSNLVGADDMELPLARATNMLGRSFGDYWLQTGSSWQLLTNTVAPGNAFVVSLGGTVVPEPSVITLSIVGGVLMVFGIYRVRKNNAKLAKRG